MSDDWDEAQAAYKRAQEIYPESRTFRDLFQHGATWQRKRDADQLREARGFNRLRDEAFTPASMYRGALAKLAQREAVIARARYHLTAFEVDADEAVKRALAEFDAAPESVPTEPTVDEWRALIHAAHDRQVAKGYDLAHDSSRGPGHLIQWAIDYARRGQTVAVGGMLIALSEVLAARDAEKWDEGAQYVLDMYSFEPYREKNPYRVKGADHAE